ncbi:PREDICTED: thaumatin-like protein 1b [Camelina sativa]|uniref:Thaumatin-like protein 1b n=1 Tax=Camelina sativa TaxID=90675 RepID=A0ABM0UE95_CAMSA|nr:PREDICTED: thaumatin-like protein 1b [Camelina sativa]
MGERNPFIFFLASHLFISRVLSRTIITIENKCDQTVWPVIYSWNSQITTTGFTLKTGEARDINAPSSWYGIISGRTLCSTAAGNFSCVTGDCDSGKIECSLDDYGWSPVTYAYFRFDNKGGSDSYTISVEYGYNLPIVVIPSQNTSTCIPAGCVVDDLNKTCPEDLKTFSGDKLVACSSACQESGEPEICCTNDYKSKENCKPTTYTNNFESACPRAYVYAYDEYVSTFTCPNSTDYVVTFCASSLILNNTTNSSMYFPD